jgi:uncharacterized membrane protein YgdD (TMEM256/DUF423 family)
MSVMPPSRAQHAKPTLALRLLAAAGACLLALSVALAAYASHGVEGEAQSRLQTAAAFAFGHGLALAALAPQARTRWAAAVLAVLLVGTVLFCGALAASVLLGANAATAPLGGGLLIAGWLGWAVAALRAR